MLFSLYVPLNIGLFSGFHLSLSFFTSGGLEPLFGNKDSLSVELTEALTPAQFLLWTRDNLLGGDKKHELIVDDKMFGLLILLFPLAEPVAFL